MFRFIAALLAALVLVAVVAVFGLSNYYNNMVEPVDPQATEDFVLVNIPHGANTEVIASILYDHGLIHNETVFRFYVRRQNSNQGFVAGQYYLSPSMDLEQIVEITRSGAVYAETVWFTIPEGFTIEQIANRLEEKGLVDHQQILSLAREPSAAIMNDFPFLQEIDDPDIEYLLEGYLFPDTYEVYFDAGAEGIIRIMLRQTERIMARINGQNGSEQEYTLHEILTVASIVEREARVDHERKRVAGVFYNRLDRGQKLESCATIQYILDETKERLTNEDLKIPSPYNTYQNPGLPPGPIASPGEKSMAAAFYPEDHDYYYFNYKNDGSGEHYFSKTFEEHNRNIRRARDNNR